MEYAASRLLLRTPVSGHKKIYGAEPLRFSNGLQSRPEEQTGGGWDRLCERCERCKGVGKALLCSIGMVLVGF